MIAPMVNGLAVNPLKDRVNSGKPGLLQTF